MGPILTTRRVTILTGFLVAGALAGPACGPRESRDYYTIEIDRTRNGAADPRETGGSDRPARQGKLQFEAIGYAAVRSTSPSAEERAAARQAAMIDALGKAVIAARQGRGESQANFSEPLSNRLTLTHRLHGIGNEFEIRFNVGGLKKTIIVRDGELQHPPHDIRLIHRVFEETGGAYSLLPANPASADTYVARVGHYTPQHGTTRAIAGSVAVDDVEMSALDSTTP